MSVTQSKSAKKNPHAGHRERLRSRFMKDGIDSLSTHEVLELLLFYAIPQADTNTIAHELIDTYGSISGVFDASFDSLLDIYGLGNNSAMLIKLIPSLCRVYTFDKKLNSEHGLIPSENYYELLTSKFIDKVEEHIALMLLSPNMKVLYCDFVGSGNLSSTTVNTRDIIKKVIKFDARFAIIAHNHPSGIALPSDDDIETTKLLRDALYNVDVTLLDHIIVANNTYASIDFEN